MPSPITVVAGDSVKLIARAGFNPNFAIIQQPAESIQDPQTGYWTTTLRFVGLRPQLESHANWVSGFKRIAHQEGIWYQLTAEFPGQYAAGAAVDPNTLIASQWSLDPARLTKDLWLFPPVRDALLTIGSAEKRARFRADFEALVAGTTTFAPVPGLFQGESDPIKDQTAPPPPLAGVPSCSIAPGGAPFMQNSCPLTFTNLCGVYGVSNTAVVPYFNPGTGIFDRLSPYVIFWRLLKSRGLGTASFYVPSVVLTKIQTSPPTATAAPPVFDNYGLLFTTPRLLRDEPTITPLIQAAIRASSDMMAGYWFKEMPSVQPQDILRSVVRTTWTFADSFDPFPFYGGAFV